jgi:hypothetical protein
MYKEVEVFIENKPGRLSKVSKLLGEAGIDLLSLDLADEGQYGVLKLLSDDQEKAREVLAAGGFRVAMSDIVAIEIADKPGGLQTLAKAIEDAGLNITDAYGCILERGKRAVFVVKGENLAAIENAVTAGGLKSLSRLV